MSQLCLHTLIYIDRYQWECVYYLQRSYPSEYKRYSPNALIIISIEDSSSMPDPAPQPQEQPPQVPRPPQDAVVQNIVASATPAADTPATPDQLRYMSY